MDLEEAFQVVGEFGPYQKRAVSVLVLTQVYMACQSMLIVLIGFTPQYRIEQQDGVPSNQQELLQHVTFTEDVDSIVTEWFLIKQQAYKVSLAGSLFFAGLLVGNIIFGPLSDRIGRRPVWLRVFLSVGVSPTASPNLETTHLLIFLPVLNQICLQGLGLKQRAPCDPVDAAIVVVACRLVSVARSRERNKHPGLWKQAQKKRLSCI